MDPVLRLQELELELHMDCVELHEPEELVLELDMDFAELHDQQEADVLEHECRLGSLYRRKLHMDFAELHDQDEAGVLEHESW